MYVDAAFQKQVTIFKSHNFGQVCYFCAIPPPDLYVDLVYEFSPCLFRLPNFPEMRNLGSFATFLNRKSVIPNILTLPISSPNMKYATIYLSEVGLAKSKNGSTVTLLISAVSSFMSNVPFARRLPVPS